jgi:hypothetical protein
MFYRFELPEVPTFRRNDYSIAEERLRMKEYNDPSGLKEDTLPWLNLPNILNESRIDLIKFKCVLF